MQTCEVNSQVKDVLTRVSLAPFNEKRKMLSKILTHLYSIKLYTILMCRHSFIEKVIMDLMRTLIRWMQLDLISAIKEKTKPLLESTKKQL